MKSSVFKKNSKISSKIRILLETEEFDKKIFLLRELE